MTCSKNAFGSMDSLKKGFLRRTVELFAEYEAVKLGASAKFNTATDFFNAYQITKSNFFKLYNRYKQQGDPLSLLPRKRGPKYGTRKFGTNIEQDIIKLRADGFNRFEIYSSLQRRYKGLAPCATSIYNMFRRHNLNVLGRRKTDMIKERIVTERIGELGHIDCHYLPKSMIAGESRQYLVGIIDDASRLMWATIVPDLTSMRVSFGAMRCLHALDDRYGVRFEKMMTDNGAEFGSGRIAKNKTTNPFKIMLEEMGITQVHIKPYHPQTNGKIERVWRTMDEELIDADWDSWDEFEVELLKYILYYNEHRIHQGIGMPPILKKDEICSRII